MFNEILDELLDDTHQVLAEEFQLNQIRRFNNNISPRNVFKSSSRISSNNQTRRSSIAHND